MTLLQIFSSPIASGAQLFLLIVCILIGLGAGISLMDAKNTTAPKESEKK
jgi:F0F1-type ATP synthase assembly protein I